MATSSIHIATGGNGYFAHNSRESHTNNVIFDDEQNYCSCTNAQAFETYKAELQKRSDAYTERTGQKLQSKSVTHLSAIVNFNKEHTEKDIQKVCKYLEKTFDTKVIQFAMHRDEGHINESGEKVKNYHAHIEFMGLDSKGNSVRRKLNKQALVKLQSETAKILNMERGTESVYTKEEYEKITSDLKAKEEYTDKKEYNKAFNEKAKELGLYRPKKAKRLDTYEFKTAKEMESAKIKELLATKEQLKEANNKLRAFMKENQAVRTDYAPLEAEKKILEEKLKAKELTEKELLEKFQELEKNFLKEKSHLTSIIEVKEIDNLDLKNQNKSLEAQKEVLSNKVTDLQEKINSSSNMSDSELKKELQNIINDEIEIKNVKTGVFSTEEAPVIKNSKSFLQKIQDLTVQGTKKIKSEFEALKAKYNDLVKKFNEVTKEKDSLANENKTLKAELEELKERSSTKQIEKENLNILKSLQSEAKRDGLDTRESEALFNKNQEEKTEEIFSKKRDFGRSR